MSWNTRNSNCLRSLPASPLPSSLLPPPSLLPAAAVQSQASVQKVKEKNAQLQRELEALRGTYMEELKQVRFI